MGRITANISFPFPAKRDYNADLSRIDRRIRTGKSITLYRGEHTVGHDGVTPRTLKRVKRGQSWATSARHALSFAGMGNWKYKGRLYAITVPASEFKGATDSVGSWRDYDKDGRQQSHAGKWSVMTDWGELEIRPNRDRPDLKPKVVAKVSKNRSGAFRFELARRLRRQRGGAAVRGGGA